VEDYKQIKIDIISNQDELRNTLKEIENTKTDLGYRLGKLEAKHPEFEEILELVMSLFDIAETKHITFKEAIEEYTIKDHRLKSKIIDKLIEKDKEKNIKTEKSTNFLNIKSIKLLDIKVILSFITVIIFSLAIIFKGEQMLEGLKIYKGNNNVQMVKEKNK
jgi:hypothetical protein